MRIKVLSAAPGSGKTSRMIDQMKENPEKRYIYVGVLLSECHRIAGTKAVDPGIDDSPKCREIEVFSSESSPNPWELLEEVNRETNLVRVKSPIYDKSHPLYRMRFIHPTVKNKMGSKSYHIKQLITQGKNIVCTHELFRKFDSEMLIELKEQGYTLILDEVLNVFEVYKGFREEDNKPTELNVLLERGSMVIEDDGFTLGFTQDESKTRFKEEYNLCEMGSLLCIDKKVALIEFPIKILRCFPEVIICTYKFEGSYMKAYLDAHEEPYAIEVFGLKGSDFKHLIDVIECPQLDKISFSKRSYSKSHQDRLVYNKEDLRKFHSFVDWFRKSDHYKNKKGLLVTCTKDNLHKLFNGRFKKDWVYSGARATNKYDERDVVLYIINKYTNPMINKYLSKRGVTVDSELFALEQIVQFVFRSSVRKGKKIKLLIPSKRMRSIFKRWLDGEFDEENLDL